jgi:hypothetical protein
MVNSLHKRPTISQFADEEVSRSQREVNMACLRATVKILAWLPSRGNDTASGDGTDHVASRLFIRYSSILFKVLDWTRGEGVSCYARITYLPALNVQQLTDDRASEMSSLSLVSPSSGFSNDNPHIF